MSNLTRVTLLQKVTDPANTEAWEEFESYYRKFIFYIINQLKVPQDDCDDLAQEVLIRLAKNLDKYDRTRAGFRTWLSTICRNCVYTYYNKKNRLDQGKVSLDALTENHSLLNEDKRNDLEEMIELEWKNYLTSLAIERVRPTFRGNAMIIFERHRQGENFESIAQNLEITAKSASVINRRVYNKLILEIKNLVFELEGRQDG